MTEDELRSAERRSLLRCFMPLPLLPPELMEPRAGDMALIYYAHPEQQIAGFYVGVFYPGKSGIRHDRTEWRTPDTWIVGNTPGLDTIEHGDPHITGWRPLSLVETE